MRRVSCVPQQKVWASDVAVVIPDTLKEHRCVQSVVAKRKCAGILNEINNDCIQFILANFRVLVL